MTATALKDFGSVPTSEVRVESGNAQGSTNTSIRRYSVTVRNIGTAITYADSATLGATFTINVDGVYTASYSDLSPAGPYIGISQNSNQLSTSINSITNTHRLAATYTNANLPSSGSATFRAVAGDVIRPHAQSSTMSNGDVLVWFHIAQVSIT